MGQKINREEIKTMFKKIFGFVIMIAVVFLAAIREAMAAVTVPTLPTTDLETAATAVLGLIAVYVVCRLVIRMLKSS